MQHTIEYRLYFIPRSEIMNHKLNKPIINYSSNKQLIGNLSKIKILSFVKMNTITDPKILAKARFSFSRNQNLQYGDKSVLRSCLNVCSTCLDI